MGSGDPNLYLTLETMQSQKPFLYKRANVSRSIMVNQQKGSLGAPHEPSVQTMRRHLNYDSLGTGKKSGAEKLPESPSIKLSAQVTASRTATAAADDGIRGALFQDKKRAQLDLETVNKSVDFNLPEQ